MEPVPLQNCLLQLKSLNYSPILGNKPMSKDNLSKSQIPALSNQTKSKTVSSASVASSLSPGVSANTKKRLFSETSPPSPSSEY